MPPARRQHRPPPTPPAAAADPGRSRPPVRRQPALASPSNTDESWISRMAEASTMLRTMKRLMALSLGTITPEASQRTRRTCSTRHGRQRPTCMRCVLPQHAAGTRAAIPSPPPPAVAPGRPAPAQAATRDRITAAAAQPAAATPASDSQGRARACSCRGCAALSSSCPLLSPGHAARFRGRVQARAAGLSAVFWHSAARLPLRIKPRVRRRA